VNDKIHAFDKPLKEGDVVEVMTRKSSLPKIDWLDLVKTSHARIKLRSQLRQQGLLERVSNAAAVQARKLGEKVRK
jgi:GTP pyrophosphokinase